MNTRILLLFVLLLSLCSFAYAVDECEKPDGTMGPCEEEKPWYEQTPLSADNIPAGFDDWGSITDSTTWSQFDSAILGQVDSSVLIDRWGDIDRSAVNSGVLDNAISASSGDLDLTDISSSTVESALTNRFNSDLSSLDLPAGTQISINTNGILRSSSDSLELSTVTGAFSLNVGADGTIQVIQGASSETTPSDTGENPNSGEEPSETPATSEPATIDLTHAQESGTNFELEIATTATEPTRVTLGNGEELFIHPGSRVRVRDGEVTVESAIAQQGQFSITGETEDIVTVIPVERDVSIYVNEEAPQNEGNYVNFQTATLSTTVNGAEIASEEAQSFTMSGQSFAVEYTDQLTGRQQITLDENEISLLSVQQLSTGSLVQVEDTGGTIYIGSLTIRDDRFVRTPSDFTEFSMPAQVTIAATTSVTNHDEVYNWDNEDFTGQLTNGNFPVQLTQDSTIQDLIDQRQTDQNGEQIPTEDELLQFLAIGYGFTDSFGTLNANSADTLSANSNARASSFPPIANERQVFENDGTLAITYNDGTNIQTLSVVDTNNDGRINNQDIINTAYQQSGAHTDLTESGAEYAAASEFLEAYNIEIDQISSSAAARGLTISNSGSPIIPNRAITVYGDTGPAFELAPDSTWIATFQNGQVFNARRTVFSVGAPGGGLDGQGDSWTNAGYGNRGPYLTPGVVAVHANNPWGLENGDIIMGDDGYVYIVADVYNEGLETTRVDVYMSSGEGAGRYDTNTDGPTTFSVIGHSDERLTSQTTPGDIRTILSQYGQFPPGESAAETIVRTGNVGNVAGVDPDAQSDILRAAESAKQTAHLVSDALPTNVANLGDYVPVVGTQNTQHITVNPTDSGALQQYYTFATSPVLSNTVLGQRYAELYREYGQDGSLSAQEQANLRALGAFVRDGYNGLGYVSSSVPSSIDYQDQEWYEARVGLDCARTSTNCVVEVGTAIGDYLHPQLTDNQILNQAGSNIYGNSGNMRNYLVNSYGVTPATVQTGSLTASQFNQIAQNDIAMYQRGTSAHTGLVFTYNGRVYLAESNLESVSGRVQSGTSIGTRSMGSGGNYRSESGTIVPLPPVSGSPTPLLASNSQVSNPYGVPGQ